MADRRQEKYQHCVAAFRRGHKRAAELLLTRIKPVYVTYIRTTFRSLCFANEVVAMVSLLHLAAYWGWKDIAACLVTVHNCSVMWKDEEGSIPLHYAAYNGHLMAVRYFTAKLLCEDPMARNNENSTPLHYACRNDHLNIVRYLIGVRHCNPSCVDKYGDTLLHIACRNGHFNIVQYLIEEVHCDPSCVDKYGNMLLHVACRNGHLTIVQYLIAKARYHPLCKDSNERTPLHIACSNGHFNIVQYLISEAQCNPSCEDKDGATPLHMACANSNAHIVQYLLSTGRVNPLGNGYLYDYGFTPLAYASRNYDIIKLFQPFIDCSKDFPVHTFTKLILTGDSGAGKTTIAQLISNLKLVLL